jgi:hypothetical protein
MINEEKSETTTIEKDTIPIIDNILDNPTT